MFPKSLPEKCKVSQQSFASLLGSRPTTLAEQLNVQCLLRRLAARARVPDLRSRA